MPDKQQLIHSNNPDVLIKVLVMVSSHIFVNHMFNLTKYILSFLLPVSKVRTSKINFLTTYFSHFTHVSDSCCGFLEHTTCSCFIWAVGALFEGCVYTFKYSGLFPVIHRYDCSMCTNILFKNSINNSNTSQIIFNGINGMT